MVAADDGHGALHTIAREQPALVLLDMGLSLVDGYGVAAALQ